MYSEPVNKLNLLFVQEFNRINQLFSRTEAIHSNCWNVSSLSASFLLHPHLQLVVTPSDEQLLAINSTDCYLWVIMGSPSWCHWRRQEWRARLRQMWRAEGASWWKRADKWNLQLTSRYGNSGNLASLETQYHQWTNKEDSQTEEFWVEELNYKDSSGDQTCNELVLFALSLLAMPLSNADVKQVFSQMSLVKSKLRNRSSALHIKYGPRRQGIRCQDFVPSQETLQRFYNWMIFVSRASESRETDAEEDSEDGF